MFIKRNLLQPASSISLVNKVFNTDRLKHSTPWNISLIPLPHTNERPYEETTSIDGFPSRPALPCPPPVSTTDDFMVHLS
ncbi:hypothetical protein DPMN_139595 [Dreissena polymorpha]|uniref:Uncharacterized protein n=1 Tax=Dreissena polymorpha TaxID=45954 RepID=A0A9D4JI93_DREPO|nr:hypothetical protein DPMN_139595 [Dreissena polymorpha]